MSAVLYAARGSSQTTSDLYTVDPATGAMTSVGPIGFALTGLAQDPTTGTIYGLTSNNSAAHPKSLITIDPATGAGTFVGAISTGRAPWTDIAFDSTGQLYAQGQSSRWITVNKATGAGTAGTTGVGSTNGGGISIDSADAAIGAPVGIGFSGGKLYAINKTTGVYTAGALITGIPNSDTAVTALAYDGSDVLWAVLTDQSTHWDLATIDDATGAVTSIGAMTSRTDALAWLTVTAPPADDFSASITPTSLTLFQGDSDTVALSTAITLGAAQSLALSATGVPAGATVTFAANPITSGAGTTVTVDAGTAALGTHSVVLHLVGEETHVVTLALTVIGPVEKFEAAVAGTGWECNGIAILSSDGASEGAKSLRIDPHAGDSYIDYASPPPHVPTGDWTYTSFAIYVPSWADFWDGGNAWDPTVLSFGAGPFDLGKSAYLQPTSPTTGNLEVNFGEGFYIDSGDIPDGQWVAIEVAYMWDGSNVNLRFWIDGVDSGILTQAGGSGGGATSGLSIGDVSWGGTPPSSANVTYYVDDFHYSIDGRIGPVDLTDAFFDGVDSGTQVDACTGLALGPVDDAYTVNQDRTLTVTAPGVLTNDYAPTTATLNTSTTHGTVTLSADGSFVYVPDLGYFGADSFTYDGNGGTGTVAITVTATELHPIFDGSPFFKAEA